MALRGSVHTRRPSGCGASLAELEDAGPVTLADKGRRSVVAGFAVDALAEQVGVAVVARVLLDHVGHDPAQ